MTDPATPATVLNLIATLTAAASRMEELSRGSGPEERPLSPGLLLELLSVVERFESVTAAVVDAELVKLGHDPRQRTWDQVRADLTRQSLTDRLTGREDACA